MKNFTIARPLTVIVFLSLFLFSCNIEKRDWENVKKINTLSEYKSFLNKYKDGKYTLIANSIIDSLEWNIAISGDSLESYQTYVKLNPLGKNVKDANLLIEEYNIPTNVLEYRQIVKEYASNFLFKGMNEDEVYKDVIKSGVHYKSVAFLEMFPKSNYINEIRKNCAQFRILTLSEDKHDSSMLSNIFISADDLKNIYGYNGVMKIFQWGEGLSGRRINEDGNQVFFGRICIGNLQILSGEFSPTIRDEKEGFLFQKGSKILYPIIKIR